MGSITILINVRYTKVEYIVCLGWLAFILLCFSLRLASIIWWLCTESKASNAYTIAEIELGKPWTAWKEAKRQDKFIINVLIGKEARDFKYSSFNKVVDVKRSLKLKKSYLKISRPGRTQLVRNESIFCRDRICFPHVSVHSF